MLDSLVELSPGSVLSGRFEITQAIGRGGFGIVYLAYDLQRGDECVIKELAPAGCYRREDGVMVLPQDVPGESQRLRQRFIDEARIVSRLNVPGVIPVRAYFHENGTAYYASDYLRDSLTLEHVIKQEGRLDSEGALDILFQLIEILAAVHEVGVLHRDIKPSNILIDPKGRAHLIDFGAAREWHADSTTHHTVLFTPGYAPIEQLSERAPRGPATDIYALCATAYHMLTGECPPSATDRASGVPLPSLARLRSDIEAPIITAIEKGLELQAIDRPRTINEFKLLVSEIPSDDAKADELEQFDRKAYELQRFSCSPRECPHCGEPLSKVKPLRSSTCPVCRKGLIKVLTLSEKLCPSCKTGMLRHVSSDKQLLFCPLCKTGHLEKHKKSLLAKKATYRCKGCGALLEDAAEGISLTEIGRVPTDLSIGHVMGLEEWCRYSERSSESWVCDVCDTQYDLLADGRRLEVNAKRRTKPSAYYADEWARIAVGLDPGAGNASCDTCQADFFVEGEKVTLHGAHHDPYGFAEAYAGRLLRLDDLRWLAVGKRSPNPGLTCSGCGVEFDLGEDGLILVQSPSVLLSKHTGEVYSHSDWCRIGKGLPTQDDEMQFEMAFDEAILNAYESGRIDLDPKSKNGESWKSPAERYCCEGDDWIEEGSGQLIVRDNEILFGGLIRKTRIRFADIASVWSESGNLLVKLKDGHVWAFTVPVIDLNLSLSSGYRTVQLTVLSLSRRIEAFLPG
jgi:serine/threonine protein kinase